MWLLLAGHIIVYVAHNTAENRFGARHFLYDYQGFLFKLPIKSLRYGFIPFLA